MGVGGAPRISRGALVGRRHGRGWGAAHQQRRAGGAEAWAWVGRRASAEARWWGGGMGVGGAPRISRGALVGRRHARGWGAAHQQRRAGGAEACAWVGRRASAEARW